MTRPYLLVPSMLVAIGGCTVYQEFYTHKGASAAASGSSSGDVTSGTGGAGGATTSSTGGTGGAPCTPGETASCYSGLPATEGVGLCKAGTKTCANDGSGFGPCVGEVLPQPENCATPEDEDCDGKAPPCKGGLAWAEGAGDASAQIGTAIATDTAGNVLVTGGLSGSADFGGSTLTSAGGTDVFLIKLDAGGAYLWSKSYGDPNGQYARGVTADTAGNVLVTGYFYGSMNFGGAMLTSAGNSDIFVVKLDTAGNHMWSKLFGDANGQSGYSITTDAMGNVLVTGSMAGTVDFGGGPLVGAGGSDIFVVKLDAAGNHVWSKRFGDANSQIGYGVATDATGNVLVTGYFEGMVNFGGGSLASAGGSDIIMLKLDTAGSHLWSRRVGAGGDDVGNSVATDAMGNVLVTGYFDGSVDFGGGLLTSAGGGDVFVVKLEP
jgi:hypothetical protein